MTQSRKRRGAARETKARKAKQTPSCCEPVPAAEGATEVKKPDCCEPVPSARGAQATKTPSCCGPAPDAKGKGFLLGIVYGLVPHTFCILFIVLSIVGATAATSVIKKFLYIPYLFQIIVGLSFVFATISAWFYLRRNGLLSFDGAKAKWKYLTILYGTTVGINLLFFTVIFPIVANMQLGPATPVVAAQGIEAQVQNNLSASLSGATSAGAVRLQVSIPCPGHAPLIKEELQKLDGITGVRYQYPNVFQVTYDAAKLDPQKILALAIFRDFPAKVLR